MSQTEITDYNKLFPDVSNLVVEKYALLVEFIIKEIQNIPEYQLRIQK